MISTPTARLPRRSRRLPGASFVVNGAVPAHDSALTTASAEMKFINGISLAATFEGEFSEVTRSYAGKGKPGEHRNAQLRVLPVARWRPRPPDFWAEASAAFIFAQHQLPARTSGPGAKRIHHSLDEVGQICDRHLVRAFCIIGRVRSALPLVTW